MRTRVTCTFTFEAAHQLPWHAGRCRRLHGHHYRLEVCVEGPLDERGVVVDFDELSAVVRDKVVDRYDHQLLNDFFDNPTAELIAHGNWTDVEAAGIEPALLRLWETPDAMVEIMPGPSSGHPAFQS
jgi:6-pyruvoyltetrahydropterin/6-carboxytetrahydropterin synthase